MHIPKTFAALLTAVVFLCPLAAFPQAYNPAPVWQPSDIIALINANAPVQSVNSATGVVVVPTYARQLSAALTVNTSDGTVTWTFPTSFTNQPSCVGQLSATTTTYTFDAPLLTAINQNSVSYQTSAHPKQLSILSLGLPINLTLTTTGVPSGTTMTIFCLAPM